MSRYKVTVEWGDSLDRPDLTKSYPVEADSPLEAIRKVKEDLGYNPGVPMQAREEKP